jgi:alpha-1,6-mannosyltransferase
VRICDIDSFYSPRGGGVRTYHDKKIEYFVRHSEHSYTLICPGSSRRLVYRAANVTVVELPGPRVTDGYRLLFNAGSLRRALDRIQPDLVEIGEPYILPWVARIASTRRCWPILGYWHADFPVAYVGAPISKFAPRLAPTCERVAWWYARRTYGSLDGIMAASRSIMDRMEEHKLPCDYQVPLGVDTRLFHPGKRDSSLRQTVGCRADRGEVDRKVIFFPHRLATEKRLGLMLESFSLIAESLDVSLVFAGMGPGQQLVQEAAARHKNIFYLGYVTDRELLARWYASADVVCALCPTETFGLAVLEAMASGVSVVAVNQGAVSELVQASKCGFTIPPDDPPAVAEAVVRLLENPEERKAAGRRGRAWAEACSDWDSIFDHQVDCYRAALHSHSSSRQP